jgi:hypothetical protein
VVRIERFDDAGAFFAHVSPFLARREAEHNLLLGFRSTLERDPHAYGPDDPYLAAAKAGDEVVGVAVRTPPHTLVLSLMEMPVVEAFAASLRDARLPGVSGPADVAASFVERLGAPAARTMASRIYEASEVVAPRPVRGRMRDTGADDRGLLVAWYGAFLSEVGGPAADAPASVDRRLAEDEGAFVVWEDEAPVSFLGYGSPTPNGMRVGPVYTPPELRGRGYASALTAAATQLVLDGGRRFCFLYTDLANPTSNSIYRRIGYRPMSDAAVWRFSGG